MQKSSSSHTSWQSVSHWYDEKVGEKGHYYHRAVILPKLQKILSLSEKSNHSLLDLCCGQGILSRTIASNISYVGVDAAGQLIEAAKKYPHPACHSFILADVTKKLELKHALFSHATLILALQNVEDAAAVFKNAHDNLHKNGLFTIVINHPCFRIPRQSSWQVDLQNKMQYRRIDKYMSDMKIPIQANPGKGKASAQTWSFHHSLSTYSKLLKDSGFTIDLIDEWCSDKTSEGAAAKMENRSRQEFPLFMAIVARKL